MINIIDSDQWEEIFDSLTKNKARTFLTAFGIFWGIFMLILLMGGGKGLQTMLASNFAGFASNSGFMITNLTSEPYKGFSKERMWEIELADVQRIKNCVPEVDIVTPTIRKWGGMAECNNRSCQVGMVGEYADYSRVDDPKIKQGRKLNEIDVIQRRKVCVIGNRVAEELFPGVVNPCGKFLVVDGVYYQVVGVSGKSGGINIGVNPSYAMHVPYTTLQQMYNRGDDVDILCVTAKDNFKMSKVQYKVEDVLKRVHTISPTDTQALMKINTEAIFDMVDSLFTGLNVLVWMIGLGTLFAGAIGVSNIMVVTVKERTTEIGIRRAIGATPRNILFMVMSESVVLTLLAGMSGILFAVLVLQVIEVSVQEPGVQSQFQIEFWLAACAALLLALLGVLSGITPAIRAMSIKPVDAMREE